MTTIRVFVKLSPPSVGSGSASLIFDVNATYIDLNSGHFGLVSATIEKTFVDVAAQSVSNLKRDLISAIIDAVNTHNGTPGGASSNDVVWADGA